MLFRSYATALVRSGEVDVILSGGTDACVTPGMMFGFSRMKVVSMAYNDRPAEASRPFDKGRDGFVLGEGAWMLVLEREERARWRGAKVYAAIEGYGSTCDAYHRVQMAPDGGEIVRAMSTAMTSGMTTIGRTQNAIRGPPSSASSRRAKPGATPGCPLRSRTPASSSAAAAVGSTSGSGSTTTSSLSAEGA